MSMEKLIDNYYLLRQNFWNFFSGLFSNWYFRVYLLVSLSLNILSWLLSRFIVSRVGSEQMALHYNVDFGIDYFGETSKIYVIPLLGLFVIFINFFLYALTAKYKDKIFISHLLFSSAILSNLILLAAVVSIYLVNFK